MARARHYGLQDGFTLIETLVALTILGLVSLFIFTGLRTGSALWNKFGSQSDRFNTLVNAQELLRQLIEQTYPGYPDVTDGSGRVIFSGTSQRINFITTMPESIGPGGFYRAQLSLNSRNQLLLSWSDTGVDPLRLETQVNPANQAEVLIGVREIGFSYFGKKIDEPNARWHDEWSAQSRLPELIRIRLDFVDSMAVFPTEVIAPQIEIDAKCVYDPLTQWCRGRQ